MLEDPPFDTEAPRKASRLLVWLLVAPLALCLALAAGKVFAGETFRGFSEQGGEVVLRLGKEPCTNKAILVVMKDRFLDARRFKAAVLTWGGKAWASCWVERQGVIHSLDEEGAAFQPVPRAAFKDESV
jgi:hypothetical protein